MKRIMPFLVLGLCCSCSGNGMSNPDSSAALDSARAHGRKDAAIFADGRASDMQREGAVLNIKYKEAHMRAMGYDKAADAYMEAVAAAINDSTAER
ncbi:MAG: hypothetical protein K2G07_01620 [Muribaculaceae bacterium]|nr:hypothetical protein [Muribaculaceae bacterium]